MGGGRELDPDEAAVVAGLRRALAESGLSQARFARALGTSASRFSTYLSGGTVPSAAFYLRAGRLGAALRAAAQESWLTPVGVIADVQAAISRGDDQSALRLLLQCRDHLRQAVAGTPELAAAWEEDPGPTGSHRWDGLLAALVGHEFELGGLPQPRWTTEHEVGDGWMFGSPLFAAGETRSATPAWLAERGIFIAARDLVTA